LKQPLSAYVSEICLCLPRFIKFALAISFWIKADYLVNSVPTTMANFSISGWLCWCT